MSWRSMQRWIIQAFLRVLWHRVHLGFRVKKQGLGFRVYISAAWSAPLLPSLCWCTLRK